MSLTVLITGPNLKPVADPVAWQTIELDLQFNQVGSGIVTAVATPQLLDVSSNPSNRVMVVLPPSGGVAGKVLMSGPIEKPGAYSWSSAAGDAASGPGMVSVSFADNLAYVAERITYPDPVNASTAQTIDYYTASAVNAETLMRSLVNLNAGPGALPARRVALLALGSTSSVGSNVNVTTRFDPLCDVLRTLALAGGGLGFRVRDSGTQLLFEVFAPAYRPNAVFGRARGNVRRIVTDPTSPTATVAIVGGTGAGVARVVVERAATTPYRRIEAFVNQTGVTDTTGLAIYGDDALAQAAEKVGLTVEAADGGGVAFGVDYDLGDWVPVILPSGVVAVEQVRAVKITAAVDSGMVITPTIGSSDATSDTATVRLVHEIMRRLGRLERI